jgi:hypothetical protein
MKRVALYVAVSDSDVLWQIKQAALEQRRTVRALVLDILVEWLRRYGYRPDGGQDDAVDSKRAEEG